MNILFNMILKQTFVWTMIIFVADMAFAMPSVSVDRIEQRYPWNGIVDAMFSVSGIGENDLYRVDFGLKVDGTRTALFPLSQNYAPGGSLRLTNGTYSVSFDLNEDFANRFGKGARLEVELTSVGTLSAPEDATGTATGICGAILVIDLDGDGEGGYSAVRYPCADTGLFNCDVYKKNKLALRIIEPGYYSIGSSASDIVSTHPQRRVRTTRPFGLGIFEFTVAQYEKMTGGAAVSTYALVNSPWTGIRGVSSPSVAPAATSVLGYFNNRVKLDGEPLVGWDLPTEIQWEIAANANTGLDWPGGSEATLGEYCWYSANAGMWAIKPCGGKKPNAFGFYDIYGNAWEWCLDVHSTVLDPTKIETPQTVGTGMEFRGGCSGDGSGNCRSSLRRGFDPSYTDNHAGFRLSITL